MDVTVNTDNLAWYDVSIALVHAHCFFMLQVVHEPPCD